MAVFDRHLGYAEIEDVLGGELGAPVDRGGAGRAQIPFEEVPIEDRGRLPIFSPGERRGEGPRANRAREPNRRRQPDHVVRIEPLRLLDVSA